MKMNLAIAQHADETIACDIPARRILSTAELVTLAAKGSCLTLVAWAPPTPCTTDVMLLSQSLPPGSALALTGDNAAQLAWRMLTRGDLRALRDGCKLRSLAVESEPRLAIEGAMQQLSAAEELVVAPPPDASRWQIEFYIRCGEQRRGDLHPCDE